MSGVQHLASDVSFGTDYEGIIQASRNMTTTFLNTASKHDTVQSVVLTSSRIVAYNPQHNKDIKATKNDWTDFFLELAKNAKQDDPNKPFFTCEAVLICVGIA